MAYIPPRLRDDYDRGQGQTRSERLAEFYAQADPEEAAEQAQSDGWRKGGPR